LSRVPQGQNGHIIVVAPLKQFSQIIVVAPWKQFGHIVSALLKKFTATLLQLHIIWSCIIVAAPVKQFG